MYKIVLLLSIALAGAVHAAGAPAEPRALFVVVFTPGPNWVAGRPMEKQDLRDHAAYHARLVKEGRAFAGGGFVGEDGGMAIVRAENASAMRAVLAADPALQKGVFKAEVRQWQPRFVADTPLVER